MTHAGPPPHIGDIHFTGADVCTSYITVSWPDTSTNDTECGPVIYEVLILSTSERVMTTTMETTYNFTGLTPAIRYSITISSTNNGGSRGSATVEQVIPTEDQASPLGNINVFLLIFSTGKCIVFETRSLNGPTLALNLQPL